MFYAYMLKCADGKYYVGHTDDIDLRVAQHQAGTLGGFTHNRRPVALVWASDFPDRDQAFAVERQIKGWSRAKKEALIAGDWGEVSRLAHRGATLLRDGIEPSTGSVSIPPQDERLGSRCEQIEKPAHPEERLSLSKTRLEGPVIVLVRPQLGENIGKAARAMLNFGLTELRLVAPRDGWPNPDAGPSAAGADGVIDAATVFASVAEAVADCAHVYATTVRKRGVIKPVVTPEAAAQTITTGIGRSAILFGPERAGLETEDVALARAILTVPINPEFGSLNLAQAVVIVAYEWSKHQSLASPPAVALDPPAPQEDLDGLIAHCERLLDAGNYFWPPERAEATRLTMRNVLTKPGWTADEVRTMRGLIRTIGEVRRRRVQNSD